jgi:hypothetical protein
MSRILITIDRLVLKGIDPVDRHVLANALKTELALILADPVTRVALSQSRRTPVLRLGRVQLAPGFAGARQFGLGIARAIGKRLNSGGVQR